MTKDEAQREVIRRWRRLPFRERSSFGQAEAFASTIAKSIEFRTMGSTERVIVAWLVRDIQMGEVALRSLQTAAQ